MLLMGGPGKIWVIEVYPCTFSSAGLDINNTPTATIITAPSVIVYDVLCKEHHQRELTAQVNVMPVNQEGLNIILINT